jgi:hypothetical protein
LNLLKLKISSGEKTEDLLNFLMTLRENMINLKKETKKIMNDEEIQYNLTVAKIHQSMSFHNDSLKFYEEKIKRESEIKDLDRTDMKIFRETLEVLQEFNLTLHKNQEARISEIKTEIKNFKFEKETLKIIVKEILSENDSEKKLENIKRTLRDAIDPQNEEKSANILILISIFSDQVYEKNKESIITLIYEMKSSLKEEIKSKEKNLSMINSKFYEVNKILSLLIKDLSPAIEMPEQENTDKLSLDYDRLLLRLHQETFKMESEELEKIIKDNTRPNKEMIQKISHSIKSIKVLKSLLINNFKMLKDYILLK